jgi:hypothetical protein
MRRAKIVTVENVTEQTNIFKYLECNISMYKIQVNLESNV